MTRDVNLFGVFVPALLVAAVGAGVLFMLMRRLLEKLRFYRLVWHPTLFDAALYILLLSAVVLVLSRPAFRPPGPDPVTSVGALPTEGIP